MRSSLALAALLPVTALCADLPVDERVPGGVAVVELQVNGSTAPWVEFGGKRMMVLRHDGRWYAVAGIPLDSTPGQKTLTVKDGEAAPVQLPFEVAPKDYPVQALTITNPDMVNPTPAQERRIAREAEHLDKVVNRWHKAAAPGVEFIWPAAGPETSAFGVKRVLNGEPRSPHGGIDIGAPLGTPLHAPADAVVADVGHYYFCGKTLTLDMGQGLYSVFCHMSIIKVSPGQKLKQGQLVGRIGATGRTTGPNLHWTVRLNGTVVDPHAFLGPNAPAPKPASTPAPANTTTPATAGVTKSHQ